MTKTFCNMCGKEFDEFDKQEHFGFSYFDIGYGSKFDGGSIHMDLCCSCFDAVAEELNKKCKYSFLDKFIDDTEER